MKVILLKDVKTLGKRGDVVEASDGYARNVLIPKKMGVEANKKNMNDLKLQQQHAEMSAGSLAGTEKTGSARAQNNDIEISAAAEALRATRVVKRGRRVYTEILDRRCVHVGFVAYEVQPCQ